MATDDYGLLANSNIAANVGMNSSVDSELKSAVFNADSSADHGKISVWVWAFSLKLLYFQDAGVEHICINKWTNLFWHLFKAHTLISVGTVLYLAIIS